MKKIYLMLLALVIVSVSFAQVAVTYTFSQSTGTYTPITGGTVYGNASSDDQRFVDPAVPLGGEGVTGPGIPIGFNFTYNGQVYDRIAINYNGWISFGNSNLTPSVNINSSSNFANALAGTSTATPAHLRNRVAGVHMDFEAKVNSELRVQTIGTGATQVCVIQWKDVQEYGFDDDTINFQIRLLQANNSVQVAFGKNARPSDGDSYPQVGLGGVTNADFNNRTGTSWNASTAGTTNSAKIQFYSLSVPPTGLIYSWTIASCLPPATVSFTSTTVPNAAISWTAVSGAAGYEYKIDTNAGNPTSGTTATNGTTGTATNIPAGSVVYAHVRTNCGSSFSAWVTKAFVPCTNNVTPANGATNVANPVSFNWSPIAGVTGYQVLFSSDNGATYNLRFVAPAPPVNNVGGLSYNTTYRWFVRGIAGADTAATSCAGSNTTTFTTPIEPNTPPNNRCTAPVALAPGTAVNGTNVGATQSVPSITCAGSTSPSPLDVWYTITARSNGTASVVLTNAASTLDAVLVAYSGSCTELTPLNCSDTSTDGGNEGMSLTGLVAGQTYLIRVYGYIGSTGTFTITASGPALPVTGITLSAIRSGSQAQLSWKTLTEINNAGFEIQRSADGKNFTSIANMISKATSGNSTAAITYNFDDVRPFAGANYYRLKQADKDGKISYSNIVYLKGIAISTLTVSAIYPNPTIDVLKAAVQAPAAESITFVVTNMMGKIISRQAANVISGDNTVNIHVVNLPSGSYLLKAICRNGCETAYQKFTKQ